ncbi:MAG: hypothetical protein ACE37F_03150 [Nannocystaceae bacterium]|nr:hypothetical protein [bacterium]
MLRRVVIALALLAACDSIPLTRDAKVQSFDTVAAALERDDDAKVLEFDKAIPRVDLLGMKTWGIARTRHQQGGKRMAVMIPLVDEGWTKDDPVAVWVRLDASTHDLDDPRMQKKIASFVKAAEAGTLRVNATQTLPAEVDMDGTNAFTIGAKRAMLKHGLVSPVGAVLATWPAREKGPLRLKE